MVYRRWRWYIFGSPKSKFFDILEQTHRDLVEEEIDKVIEKLAILELIISQDKDEILI